MKKQVERLGNDLEDQIRKGEALEARAIEAERSLHEFSRKSEHVSTTCTFRHAVICWDMMWCWDLHKTYTRVFHLF